MIIPNRILPLFSGQQGYTTTGFGLMYAKPDTIIIIELIYSVLKGFSINSTKAPGTPS